MQEKTPTQNPNEKKVGTGTQFPETGKQGGQGDVGKKGGDLGQTGIPTQEPGKTGDVGKR